MHDGCRYLSPAKLAQVLVDDTWYQGELRSWQKLDGRWRADVMNPVGIGTRYLSWFDHDRVRPYAGDRGPQVRGRFRSHPEAASEVAPPAMYPDVCVSRGERCSEAPVSRLVRDLVNVL